MPESLTEKKKSKEILWNKNFIIACSANFLVACSFNLLMPTIPLYLTDTLHIPKSDVGIVLSSYSLAMLFMRMFSGYLVDVYNRKQLFLLGLTLFVSTFVGYLFAVTILFLIILRFIHGLFWGLVTVSASTVAIDIIPSSRRAEGIGFFGMNNNLAMAIAPFIAVTIYNSYGFHFLIGCGLTMGIIAIIVVFFIQVPHKIKNTARPPISFDRFILLKGLPIFVNQLFITFGWGTLVSFAVLYGVETGIKNAGIFFLFLAAGIIISRVTSGRLVDRGHLHRVMIAALSIISLSFLLFSSFHSIYYYCITALFIGIGYGTLFPALQTIYVDMAPNNRRGTANSTYLTGFDLGVGMGMLVGSYVSEHSSFSVMYKVSALLSFIGVFIYIFNSRKVYEKNKLKK